MPTEPSQQLSRVCIRTVYDLRVKTTNVYEYDYEYEYDDRRDDWRVVYVTVT